MPLYVLMFAVFGPAMAGVDVPAILPYRWHKALHLLGVILFLGNIVVTAYWATTALRSRKPALIRYGVRMLCWADLVFTAPGMFLVLTNGTVLATERGGMYAESWLVASLVAFGVMGVPGSVVFYLQTKMFRACDGPDDAPLPDDFEPLVRRWGNLGGITLLPPIVLLFLMVIKPTLWTTPEVALEATTVSNAVAPTPVVATATIAGTGTVLGRVTLRGARPPEAAIDMGVDPSCVEFGSAMTRRFRGIDDGLQDVFVYVSSKLDSAAPPPRATVVIDQVACLYEPRVVGVRVGQPLVVVNSDPLLHNVHAEGAQTFNLAMPVRGQRVTRKFKKPEQMIRLKCDVHPWMSAWIGVLPHSHFVTTGPPGRFELAGLPAGSHTVTFWHAALGRTDKTVVVEAGRPVELEVVFDAP